MLKIFESSALSNLRNLAKDYSIIFMKENVPISKTKDICCLVILYKPDELLESRIEIMKSQLNNILLVDNNSGDEIVERIGVIAKKYDLDVIYNDENLGIAEALNQGFEYIKKNMQEVTWCLTMDQDSKPYPNMVDNLLNGLCDYPCQKKVGIIGSNYIEDTTNRILHSPRESSSNYEEVKYLPTSGCLTSIIAYDSIGGFRSSFFIDYVDTEFCMRLLDKGYKVLIVPEILMRHPLGSYRYSHLYKFLTGRDNITNYTPIRHYYWTRNGTRLILERLRGSFKWAVKEFYYLYARRLFIIVLFEDRKLTKLAFILKGIRDGIVNKNSN